MISPQGQGLGSLPGAEPGPGRVRHHQPQMVPAKKRGLRPGRTDPQRSLVPDTSGANVDIDAVSLFIKDCSNLACQDKAI